MGTASGGLGNAGLFGPAGPTQATRDNPNASIGFGMPPQEYSGDPISIQGNQPAPSPLPTNGMGGGKGGVGDMVNSTLDASGQMLNQFVPQIGNALKPAGSGIYGRDLSGNPNTQQLMGGMGTGTIAPPVNRFAPPNAPGVRPVRSNRFTRPRIR